jgi:hypothetical protein
VKRVIVVLLAAALLIMGAGTGTARATENCEWTNQVWHTWTGGPTEVAPEPTDPGWNATSGAPESAQHAFANRTPNVPYFVSHGGAGKGDWFLWTALYACTQPTPTPTPTPEPTVSPTPVPNGPTVTSEHTERYVDCELGVAIVITEWLYSDGTSRTLTEQEPLTDKEAAECQPNSTPTPTPSTKPSEMPSASPTPSPTPSTATPTTEPSPTLSTSTPPSAPKRTLAETGISVEGAIVAGLLVALGLLLVRLSRREP